MLRRSSRTTGNFFCLYHPANGKTVCWGANSKYQLGYSDAEPRGLAQRADQQAVINLYEATGADPENSELIKDLLLGESQACVLFQPSNSTNNHVRGKAFCWGGNGQSELGPAKSGAVPLSVSSALQWNGTLLELDGLGMGFQMTCGIPHLEGVLAIEGVRCWGRQFGNEDGTAPAVTLEQSDLAIKPEEGKPVQVVLGSSHACALFESNDTFCWGKNFRAQLGQGNPDPDVPATASSAVIFGGNGLYARRLFPARYHTCVVLNDGSARCWGWGENGQLGNNDIRNWGVVRAVSTLGPILFEGADEYSVREMCGGNVHTCAILEDTSVWCWGKGDRVGHGSSNNYLKPQRVAFSLDDAQVTAQQIACSSSATCALFTDSTVRCWGFGSSGQLGSGSPDDLNIASEATTLSFVHLLSAQDSSSASSSAASSASTSDSDSQAEEEAKPVELSVAFTPNRPNYNVTALLPQSGSDLEPLQLEAEFTLFQTDDTILSLPEEWTEEGSEVEADGTVRHEVSLSLAESNSTLFITHLDIKSPGVRETLPGSGRTFQVGPSVKTTLTVNGWPFYPATPPSSTWTWTMSLRLPSSQRLHAFECKSIGETVEKCLSASVSKGWSVMLQVVLEALADDTQVSITYDIVSRAANNNSTKVDSIDVRFHLPPFHRSLFFDPDLSILLKDDGSGGDGADREEEDDDPELLWLAYLLVPLFLVVILAIVVGAGVILLRRKEAKNKARINRKLSQLAAAT
ncbi:Fibronectin type-III domain-containing protein [Balamuthia mandrillaris]